MFGGCDPETGLDKYVDAFAGAFSKAQCIAAWEAVGAVPPTCACLNDKQVCWEVGDSSPDDAIQMEMTEMQRANTMACDLLTARGFKGQFLKAELKKKKEVGVALVTVPNLRERVEALAKASTHGAIFAVTGGEHFTSDDMFKAAELPARKARIAALKKEKKARLAAVEREAAGRKILEQGKAVDSLTGSELTALLKWHGVEKAGDGKVPERREKWRKIVDEEKVAPSVRNGLPRTRRPWSLLRRSRSQSKRRLSVA